MRQRAEEALSASVHHASLSQQYLTLSQKFAALAEQASSGTALGLAQTAAQLEREASTGVPANPIGLPQVAIGLPPIPQESSSGTPPISKPHFARDINAVPAKESATVRAPVGFDAGDVSSSKTPPLPDDAFKTSDDAARPPFDSAAAPAPAGKSAAPSSGTNRKSARAKRARFSVKKFLERARLVALEKAERVRLKVRRSDLKPRIRTTSEEIRDGIKQSRVPSAISMIVTILALIALALRHLEFYGSRRTSAACGWLFRRAAGCGRESPG